MKTLLCLACVAALLMSVPARADDDNVPCEKVDSIGVATMDEDRVITMHIRSLPPGPIAEGTFKYAPDSKDYLDMFSHLGGIVPGQSKPVKPWCK